VTPKSQAPEVFIEMSLSKILLLIAVILFILDALGSRLKLRLGFGVLAAGLACFAASFLL